MTMRVPIRRRMAAWRQGIVVTTVVRRDPPGAAARHHPHGAAARRWWAPGSRRSAPAALRRWIAAALAVLVGVAVLVAPLATAQAAVAGSRVDLRVLVLSDGGAATTAIATQLDREGVPYTWVNLIGTSRPVIDAAFLENAAAHEGKYQAVVLPNQAGTSTPGALSAAELAALAAYEKNYGVRQVNGYDYPGAGMGTGAPTYSGVLDGATATVSAAGLSGPFTYLKSSLKIDNFDPAVTEVYGYLAAPAASLPAGSTFTPMVSATVGSASGSILGVYAHDGREELVITAAFNGNQQWFNEIGHGIVTWLTRGIHLGQQRNYFAVQVDDVFLPDSRWSATGHCTPGDGCVDPNVTTTDIRMTPADVTKLAAWQNTNGFALDMVFNGGGSDLWKADPANNGRDLLADAFTAPATQQQFTWINHTYTHEFLGCIQIAPTTTGGQWRCAVPGDTGPYFDPSLVPTLETTVNGIRWMSQAEITSQLQQNIDWAVAHKLTHFDKTQLVTGEHSGLATLPQQPTDSPLLAGALSTVGIGYTASDASRESAPRTIGSTSTVPRHPMNIYYNAGTYTDEVSEYNWIYTDTAHGGSGICTANPTTSTCITPLPAATRTQATSSYNSYIKPLEVRNALNPVLTNDPRPFYAHQSNLAEDGVLYPVVQGLLDQYKATYNAAKAPLVHLDLKGQSQVLTQMGAWKTAQTGVTAYVDSTGVHVPAAAGGAAVPLTMPTGSTASGASLASYGGELSGWLTPPAGGVVATPPTPAGGYLGTPAATAPAAPTIGTASAGNISATVTWTAPANTGGSSITGYTVQAFAGTATTPVQTVTAAGTATSATVNGLTNGTSYTFIVSATNAVGTGPASAPSNAVIPAAVTVPGAPAISAVTAGNAAATVSWAAPANNGGSAISMYTVRAYVGTATTVATTATALGTATSATVNGLTNGTAYTVDVFATNTAGNGPASTRSAAVTPTATVPGAPTLGAVTAGNGSATVTWTAPANNGGSAITGYDVRVFAGTTLFKTGPAPASPTSLLVTGLTNGTTYTFDVAARNATGVGAASARSAPVIPAAATTTTASVTPIAVSFDSQAVGTTSAPVAVTVKNTGTGPLTISSITTGGPFAAASTTCPVGGSVTPGASCVVNVVARPTAVGDMIGTLTIVDNTAGGPQVVDLDGWGE